MKKIFLASMAFVASLVLGGCDQAPQYTDVVFFTGTETTNETRLYVDGTASASISVTCSKKVEKDMQVTIEIVPGALDILNAERGSDYEMIPSTSYTLERTTLTIEAGSSVSIPSAFSIDSMDDFVEGVNYCVPFRITGNSQGIDILGPSEYMFMFLSQVTSTVGMNLGGSRRIRMQDMVDDPTLNNLSACTMEIRIFANSWKTSGHMISALIGVEENFLLRVGDSSIQNGTQIQLSGQGASITSESHLTTGRWYHIAVVDNGTDLTIYIDGKADKTAASSSEKAINLGFYYNSPFSIGDAAADSRYFNGYVSEARVWSRALTSIELQNNQCFIDVTKANGLIGYWRCDQANTSGTTVYDLSGKGYNGVSSSSPVYTSTIKCPVLE